jgi:FAD/FMN-containing dehydrogenase
MPINTEALKRIREILGAGGAIDDPAEMAPYLTSWRNGWTGKTPLIALPNSTEQVSKLLAFCHQNKIAVVPQGGNTGLVGGGIPSLKGDELLVNLSRMNKIREIDGSGSTVTAEAGVILQRLQETVAKAGFLFPLSMASQGSAEVGGAISTNAGGTAVLRYGNMRGLVLGIEAVLPDGQVISHLKKLPKDNAGYNLAHYFIGSEGTLGIVTAATLKLYPEIRQSLTAIAAVASAEEALKLLADYRREAAEFLSAFEIMSRDALKLVMKHIPNARFPGRDDAPFYLLIELSSSSLAVSLRDLFETASTTALEEGRLLDGVVASSAMQSAQFWYLRENISEAVRKEGPGIHFDISLPLDQLAPFMQDTPAKIKTLAPNVILAPFGHIGDGNLHYNMCFAEKPDNFDALKAKLRELVYDDVTQRGGSISAEHGIGIERKTELGLYKSKAEIDAMKAIKHALDPANLMNPGKIF